MLFRALLSCAALILTLLFCLNANAEPAERPSKPLDIMQFMREQAASTRAAERPKRASPKPVAQVPKRTPVAAPAAATAVRSEAANSFAAQSATTREAQQPPATPEVDVVSETELNAIDRAGEPAPPETVGAAAPMQLVDADVSTIVTKGRQQTVAAVAEPSPPQAAQPAAPSAAPQSSWWQRLWSALRGSFAAVAAAVHALIG